MKLKKSYLMMAPVVLIGTQATLAQGQVLEEVVVTATKRATSVMDTPLSMEVMTGQTITQDNILNIEEMSQRMPSVVIANNIQTTSVNIRGMGSLENRAFEQSVAMFIDEVYMPRSKSYRAPFFDIERAEVLRGPQAVLFGVNATAGTVNIHSATTSPGTEAFAEVSAAYETEYSRYRGDIVAGGSLGDSLGIRVSLRYTDQDDGWWDNEFTGQDENTFEETLARLSLSWNITDEATLVTKINYADAEEDGDIGENNLSDAEGAATALGVFIDREYDWKRYVSTVASNAISSKSPGFDQDLFSISMKLDWELGNGTLTAVAAYAESNFDQVRNTHAFASDVNGPTGGFDILTNLSYADALGEDLANIFAPPNPSQLGSSAQGTAYSEDYNQSSLELRWASDPSRTLSYIVGAYIDTSELENKQTSLSGPILGGVNAGIANFLVTGEIQPTVGIVARPHEEWDTDTYSAFGNVTWNINDDLRVTVGGRYTDVSKDYSARNHGSGCTAFTTFDVDTQTFGGEIDINALNDIPTGLTEASCYRAVGFSDNYEYDHFMPEVVVQWDVTENSTTYAKVATSGKSGGIVPVATGKGVKEFKDEEALGYELGYKARFADGRLQLNAAIFRTEFDDLQVTSFVSEPGQPVIGITGNAAESISQGAELEVNFAATEWLTVGTSVGYLDAEYDDFKSGPCNRLNGPNPCDLSGEDTPFAPEYSGSAFADVSYPLTGNLVVDAGVVLTFSDSYFTNGALDPLGQQDSYEMWDARIGLSDADGVWSVSFVGKNLSEEEVLGGGTPFLGYIGTIGAPRTYTLMGTYRF